jgi:hypothetical protein
VCVAERERERERRERGEREREGRGREAMAQSRAEWVVFILPKGLNLVIRCECKLYLQSAPQLFQSKINQTQKNPNETSEERLEFRRL